MRYRLMATYRGVPYEAGIGPTDQDVVLFAACPPPEELGFEPATGHWRKQLGRHEVQALWESRPTGTFRGERCMVLDDLGDRLHITYLGHDAYRAEQLGYWEVDRGAFEMISPRDEITEIVEERIDFPDAAPDGSACQRDTQAPATPPRGTPVPRSPRELGAPRDLGTRHDASLPADRSITTDHGMPDALSTPDGLGIPNGLSTPDALSTPDGLGIPNGLSTPDALSTPDGLGIPNGLSMPDALSPPNGRAPGGERLLPLEEAARLAASARQEASARGQGQDQAHWPADPDLLPEPEEPSGPLTPADSDARRSRRHDSALRQLTTQRIFTDLASLAAIPQSAFAVGEEVDGAMCLLQTADGFEVFNSADGARHEVRLFEDEESAYFYLFGVLAAEAVRTGRLVPRD